jgi:hypothetical protein
MNRVSVFLDKLKKLVKDASYGRAFDVQNNPRMVAFKLRPIEESRQVASGIEPELHNLPCFGAIWQGLSSGIGTETSRIDNGRLEIFYYQDVANDEEAARDYLLTIQQNVAKLMRKRQQKLGLLSFNALIGVPSIKPGHANILQLRDEYTCRIA